MNFIYIIIGLIIFLLIIVVITYNSVIRKRNSVENAFSSIDVMLKKRHDLIPNLVNTVKQYMTYEKDLLTQITKLRTQVMQPNLPEGERLQAESKISNALSKVQVAFENYPNLKASTNFLKLQAALNETEEQISAARRTYNASINNYNDTVETFPNNIIAGMMGFKRKASFEILEAEKANVNIENLFG